MKPNGRTQDNDSEFESMIWKGPNGESESVSQHTWTDLR